MLKHVLSVLVSDGCGGDAEVAEHGVAAPTADKLDGARVRTGAEQGSSTSWTQAADRNEFRVDASGGLEVGSRIAETVRKEAGLDGVGFAVGIVGVQRCRRGGIVTTEVSREAGECLARTEVGVICSAMTDLFATHAGLLVRERECRSSDVANVLVIQSERRSGMLRVIQGEVDVAEAEDLCAGFCRGLQVFGRAQEPEETDDGQVNDVFIGLSFECMSGVQDVVEASQDLHVDGIGTCLGRILVSHGLDKSMEYGMELGGSRSRFAGIVSTQLGDPLAHCQ